jgi:hypothetical protein
VVGEAGDRSLTVLAPTADREWWDQETADYREVGLKAAVDAWPDDRWARLNLVESEVRAALGLPAQAVDAKARAHVVLDHDTPLARNWARRVARAHQQGNPSAVAILTRSEASELADQVASSSPLPTRASAEAFKSGELLPRATGPFGGTTLVVLGDALSAEEVKAWEDLEAADPLNAKSRFHRLRTARLTGERELGLVLAELKEKRRTNVLIVPAAFAEGPEAMRAIRDAAKAHQDDMTLEFRPGLGAALAEAQADDESEGEGRTQG